MNASPLQEVLTSPTHKRWWFYQQIQCYTLKLGKIITWCFHVTPSNSSNYVKQWIPWKSKTKQSGWSLRWSMIQDSQSYRWAKFGRLGLPGNIKHLYHLLFTITIWCVNDSSIHHGMDHPSCPIHPSTLAPRFKPLASGIQMEDQPIRFWDLDDGISIIIG